MSASATFKSVPPLGGRYALREPLGEGTFAVTYLAEDLVLGRLVAVKLLRARYGGDPAAAARFEREARAAAAVSSPYIVDVFDYGTDRGSAYIVLQHVEGPTLREYLDRNGRLEPREAVRLAIEVLRGLDVIHRAGIVHRDVKPQNVLLDRHGTARVTDFGVALWAGSEALTGQGLAVGTAVYMAPEQAQATDVGEGADLYAVGVLLFEMLTGTQPFHADNPTALMLAHVQRDPPLPSEALPGLVIPVALEREVMRALAKHPADRRRSAKAMADALAAATTGISSGEMPPAAANQVATTASMPALTGSVAPATRADTNVVAAPRSGAGTIRARAWLGPLALVLVAMVVLMVIAIRGGFSGLAGLGTLNGPEGDRIVGIAAPSPTASATVEPSPTATVTPEPPAGGLFSGVQENATSIAPPTIAPAADSAGPTEAPVATVAPLEPTPTQQPAAIASDEDEDEAEREPRNRQSDQEQEADPDPVTIAPSGDASPGGSAIQFSVADWQGAAMEPETFAQPAVALYGAESRFGRAVLQFELPEQPTGRLTLTLSGLGDESGLAFPFGIEVNSIYAVDSPATFDNWHPARDGPNGQNAVWDQVSFDLPPELFQAGLNEIAIVSRSSGDYDDRPPYLLLRDATLAPQ